MVLTFGPNGPSLKKNFLLMPAALMPTQGGGDALGPACPHTHLQVSPCPKPEGSEHRVCIRQASLPKEAREDHSQCKRAFCPGLDVEVKLLKFPRAGQGSWCSWTQQEAPQVLTIINFCPAAPTETSHIMNCRILSFLSTRSEGPCHVYLYRTGFQCRPVLEICYCLQCSGAWEGRKSSGVPSGNTSGLTGCCLQRLFHGSPNSLDPKC
ncbi:uncharacterized protein [Phaenicophaeus curvirostris]|uniref:uncharacterized protein n=1 Tax=Phaenicophaeus curvirostris TaxID=33595 RepID=UPI0037F0FF92